MSLDWRDTGRASTVERAHYEPLTGGLRAHPSSGRSAGSPPPLPAGRPSGLRPSAAGHDGRQVHSRPRPVRQDCATDRGCGSERLHTSEAYCRLHRTEGRGLAHRLWSLRLADINESPWNFLSRRNRRQISEKFRRGTSFILLTTCDGDSQNLWKACVYF